MKLKSLCLLLLIASNCIFSQEKTTQPNNEVLPVTPVETSANGKIENNVYICFKFDWKIPIPDRYEITNKNGAIGNTQLIAFEVDKRNTFSSSFESLTGSKITSIEEHKKFMVQLFNDTYSKIETLKFELSSADMKLGKYDFYKIQTKLYDPKTNELLLTQDLYNSFINGNLFSVNINYNNPNIGKLLTANFLNSFNQ